MLDAPENVLFFDVETTGLHSNDRVVSLGAVELNLPAIADGRLEASATYLIFDPGKKSHPRAEAVHGYSDWLLRHQEPFTEHAELLAPMFERADLLVAHNVSFDRRFVENEFANSGRSLSNNRFLCTMMQYRHQVGGRSSLNAVLAEMGLARSGERHGAFEDAWLAMLVYLWLHNLPIPNPEDMPLLQPRNLRECPPQPVPLPRRSKKDKVLGTRVSHAVSPSPPPPHPSYTPAQRASLIHAARPIATMMMWVARSDGFADESELAAVEELVSSEAERLGIHDAPALVQDVTAGLIEIEPSERLVDQAARVVIRDQAAREQVARWLRLVTYADGKTTPEEKAALARITNAFATSSAA